MKFDVFVMTIDAIVAINYENLQNAIAINFVENFANFEFNFSINSTNFEQILFVEITIYDDINIKIKFVNVIEHYFEL
jgi:hypothetical protein